MSAVCTSELHASGRRLYCSDRCRQSAHHRRHQAPLKPPRMPPRRPRRPVTVYVCPSCDAGLQRCPHCNLFCTAVGIGGFCPRVRGARRLPGAHTVGPIEQRFKIFHHETLDNSYELIWDLNTPFSIKTRGATSAPSW